MNVLKISSAVKYFEDNKALDGLDLSLESGTILGLVGPNGAGKTTTINVISSILKLDEGTVTIFDEDSIHSNIETKKRIGILYDNYYAESKSFGEIYGLDREIIEDRTDRLFRFFDLDNFRNKLLDEYSKGMKKKIALASLLIYNPEFLILDEPFEGLDALTLVKVRKLFAILKKKNRTILLSSHILAYLEDLADEIAIINKGKIVYRANIKDIRNKIKDKVTHETYNSLEEIFIDMTGNQKDDEDLLSWL